jgi:2-polyprenyl-6-methoxyphenol hydroxylase-like FAD-dependent oxidoreductase
MDADVIVVGAGPTGLLLAGDLAAAGVRCQVLERRAHEASTTRAFGVHARTLEELDARGVADELVATGTKIDTVLLFSDLGIDLSRLPTRFPFLLITPQYNTERVLQRRATSLGAEIVTGAAVTGLTQDEDGVDVSVEREDGSAVTRRARWVVGCDGVSSAVRDAIAMPYPGVSVLRSIMLADVRRAPRHPGGGRDRRRLRVHRPVR